MREMGMTQPRFGRETSEDGSCGGGSLGESWGGYTCCDAMTFSFGGEDAHPSQHFVCEMVRECDGLEDDCGSE